MPPSHVRRLAGGSAGALIAAVGLVATALPAQASTPAYDRAYLVSANDDAVTVYDTTANSVVTTITDASFDNLEGIAVSPDGTEAYAVDHAGSTNSEVFVIDTVTNTVDDTISVSSRAPYDVVFSPDGATAYVSYNVSGQRIDVIDTAARTVTDSILAPVDDDERILELDISPDGGTLYATGSNSYVLAVDTATGAGSALSTLNEAREIAVSPDGSELWVAEANQEAIEIFDTANNTSDGVISTGFVQSIGFAPDGSTAFAAAGRLTDSTAALTAYDAASRTSTAIITDPAFQDARNLEVSSDGAKVYTSSPGHDVMAVVDTATLSIDETIVTPDGPREIALGAVTPTVPDEADINVDLSATAGLLSSQITYALGVDNDGPNDATGVQVVVGLPAQTSSVSSLPAACTYNASSDDVTCDYALIGAGGSRASSFKAAMGLLSIGQLPAAATRISSSPTDPNPTNDTDTANCTVLTSLIITCN